MQANKAHGMHGVHTLLGYDCSDGGVGHAINELTWPVREFWAD
jgi:hypothetical protein